MNVNSAMRRTVLPLLIIALTPLIAPLLSGTAIRLDGSLARLLRGDGWAALWSRSLMPSAGGVALLIAFAALQVALLRWLPGPTFTGPSSGPRPPTYRLNGVSAFLVTHALIAGAWLAGWSPAWIYDELGTLLASSSCLALLLCLVVYLRGRRAPISDERGTTGHPLFDFFWGTELYPSICGIELKQLCNSRLSMMGWSVLCVAFLAKQQSLLGRISPALWVSAGLELAYVLKFFVTEKLYFTSIDIVHDRFGYYLGWGVLCWLPTLYPIAPLYLVTHPGSLSLGGAVIVGALGIVCMLISQDTEWQRERVRRDAQGASVWGRLARVVEAHYRTPEGGEHKSVLVASGWWGLSRHFHYLPELGLAIAWSLPAGMHDLLPWLYPMFIAVLLFDRANRVDRRCATKYGRDWLVYKTLVPYKLIPGLY